MTELTLIARFSESDATVWSDLAAARYESSVEAGDPSLLAEALAAADLSLRLDASLKEARFNRALVIERLGLRDQAREAWEDYLAVDAKSEWAAEARQRARTLAEIPSFKKILDDQYDELADRPVAAHTLARQNPLDARRWGETKILSWWAHAENADDSQSAAKHLHIARELGSELARYRGEGMLKAAVAAIDRADSGEREHLIKGHILFHDGQQSSLAQRPAEAQRTLTQAAVELRLGRSPVTLLAEYFVAHTFHAVGNLEEARRREEGFLASAPPEFPSYRAQLLWHIGLGYMSDGEWGKALKALTESVAIFERLEEGEFAATVRGLLTEVYDRTGDPHAAWTHRVVVLRQIGRRVTPRLQMSLASVGRGAIIRKEWAVAVSFLKLAEEVAAQIDHPAIHVEMLLLQARAYAQANGAARASEAIASARSAARMLRDDAVRNDLLADIIATEAIIAHSPIEAMTRLTGAIAYHGTNGRRIRLPDLLLNRGRAYIRLSDRDRAAADFEEGIKEVERHRRSLPQGEHRWGIFHAAEELFEEAISLALARGRVADAFAYSERARARELLDALDGPSVLSKNASASASVIVEYAALPDRLVLFIAANGALSAVEHHVSRTTLEAEAERFRVAVQTNSSEFRPLGARLHGRLIEPIAALLRDHHTIVFIPGSSLGPLPFAALLGADGRFLIERHAIVVSESAAVYHRIASRKALERFEPHLLVVFDPTTEESGDPLPTAAREATAISAMYSRVTELTRTEATPAAFERAAPGARIIHLATHGITPAGTRDTAALLLAGGRLDVRRIASIRLVGAPIVVLAACSTARGTTRSEGTISVSRAFLTAGASSVIATLWPIEDANASRFFPHLHRHLARGGDPAQALRATQLQWIRRGNISPSLWAAVQCMGS